MSSAGRRDVRRSPSDSSSLRDLPRATSHHGVSHLPVSSLGVCRVPIPSPYIGQALAPSPMLWSWVPPSSPHENPETPQKALESLDDAVRRWREEMPMSTDIDRETPPKAIAPARFIRSFSDNSATPSKETPQVPPLTVVTRQRRHGPPMSAFMDRDQHIEASIEANFRSDNGGKDRKQHIHVQQEAPRVPSLFADAKENIPPVLRRPASAPASSEKHGARDASIVEQQLKERLPKPPELTSQAITTVPTASMVLPLPLSDFSVTTPHLGPDAAGRSLEELPSSIRNALNFLRTLPELPRSLGREYVLPEQVRTSGRTEYPITLVLDLDETLAHCSRNNSCWSSQPPDVIVNFEDQPSQGNVHFRPFAKLFLEVVARSFEVVVFTASQQSYADKVLDMLDPTGTTIHHRLYRPHCTKHRGAYFKELGLLGRPLSRCILVDNSPISCACNPDNSVLCRSWYGHALDRELLNLLALLEEAQQSSNIPRHLASRYGLHDYFQALRLGPPIAR